MTSARKNALFTRGSWRPSPVSWNMPTLRLGVCCSTSKLIIFSENTAIFLVSDNGGAPEAGVRGGFARPYGDPTTVHEMRERLDNLGTEKTQTLYQRPWAMASVTPFRFYKLWPYRGGVQTPFIVSWPDGIRVPGRRRQFVDMIDITPTFWTSRACTLQPYSRAFAKFRCRAG